MRRAPDAAVELRLLAEAATEARKPDFVDFMTRLREREPACVTELDWLACQRDDVPVKLLAINSLLDRTCGRPAAAVD